MNEDCFYCTEDERLQELMVPVIRLSASAVYLMRDQLYPGRCVVASAKHVREIFELKDTERDCFFADVARVARAISVITQPDKINYAIYGDLVSHFHVHLVPKKRGGPHWGEPFCDKDDTKWIAEQGYLEKMVESLRRAIKEGNSG